MFELIVVLKALVEVAGVGMLGQGLLYVLAGAKRDQNAIYNLFKVITSPVMKATRAITPRIVLDQHIGLVAFFLLIVFWLALTTFKIKLALDRAAAS
jgi:uncharacterized membrane protein